MSYSTEGTNNVVNVYTQYRDRQEGRGRIEKREEKNEKRMDDGRQRTGGRQFQEERG